jgi:hypothetical protein
MNKKQLLVLLILVALAFYYLNQETKPSKAKTSKKSKSSEPWLILKPSPKSETAQPEPKVAQNSSPQISPRPEIKPEPSIELATDYS